MIVLKIKHLFINPCILFVNSRDFLFKEQTDDMYDVSYNNAHDYFPHNISLTTTK